MKQKLKLLSFLLFLGMVLSKTSMAQSPPTVYTSISSGNQTLDNDTVKTLPKWYRWFSDTGVVHVGINLKLNGSVKQLASAELYTVNSGTLVLMFKDSLYDSSDSILNLYAGYVAANTEMYIKVITAISTCTSCANNYPIIKLKVENVMVGCAPVTPCDMVKNGGFESDLPPGCGVDVNNGADCWLPYENSTDLYRRYCNAGQNNWFNLGSSTSNTNPILNSHNGAPNNAIIGQFCWRSGPTAAEYYNESVQTLLTTPLISGRTYSLSFWVYNYSGQIMTSATANPAQAPCWVTFASSIGTTSSPSSNPAIYSTYPVSPFITPIVNILVTPINAWTAYTHTFTFSGSASSNLLVGPNIVMNTGVNGFINQTSNKMMYIAFDDVSLIDITGIGINVTQNHVNCQSNLATYTLNATGANSYTWQPSGSNSTSIVVTPTANTIYTLSGMSNNAPGCIKTATYAVNILPNPTGTVIATPSVICQGSSTTLSVTGTGFNQNLNIWTPTPCVPASCVGQSITVTPSVTTTYTVKLSSANGCTNTVQYVVNVVTATTPTITAVANPTSICVGSTSTLTASGASTYTWSTGAISPSISVSPSVTTVYTVQGTSVCGNISAPTTVTVFITPNPTVTVNSATICVGNSVTLSASGATTYSWSNGATTSTIAVSPTVTTNYSVTGYDAGCSGAAVSTVSVIANTLPGAFTINSSAGLPIIANGTGTNTVGFTTSLSSTVGLTFAWSNGVSTPTASYGITQPQIVSLNVSTPFCGTTTQSICVNYVAQACSNYTGSILSNTTIGTTSQSNQTFKVAANATVTISGAATFSTCTFLMGTNSAIVVTPTSQLALTTCSLFSCDGMWYGIKAQNALSNAASITLRGTTIEDAYKAIDADNSVNSQYTNNNITIHVTSVLNKNYIDVSITNQFAYSGTHPLVFLNSQMISNASTTSPGTNLKCSSFYTVGVSPIRNRSYAGIYADKSSAISFTNNAGANNVVKNKDYGLYLKKTDADVYNVNFSDMIGYQNDPVCEIGFPCVISVPTGVAIFSNSGAKYLNVKPLGGSTTVNTYFSNVGYGILALKTVSVDVQYCNFDNSLQATSYNLSTGILTSTGNKAIYTLDVPSTLRVNKNTINRTYNGVSVNYSVATTNSTFLLSVGQNTITAGTGTLTAGIDVLSALASPFNGTITSEVIAANTITNANSFGIRLQNVTGGLRVSGNTISLKTGTSGVKDGIFLNGGNSNVLVDNNNIDGSLTGTVTAFNVNSCGIRCLNSAGCKIQCNTVTNIGKGIEYNGGNSSPGDGFFKNTLQFPIRRGFILSNGGLIGMQGSNTGTVTGASANVWAGAWPTPANTAEPQQTFVGGPVPSSTQSDAANSPLWVRNTTTETPFDNYYVLPSQAINIYATALNTLYNFTTTVNDYTTCPTKLTQGAKMSSTSSSGNSIEDRDADFVKYISNLLPAASTSLTPQDKFMLKQFMFDDLSENPSANTNLQSFYSQQQNTAIGAYSAIDALLAAGNIAAANTKNTQAAITNDITQTQNNFNTLYINGINNQSDFDNLQHLANLCPNQYGNAVFQARALLQIYTYQYVEYNDSCYSDKLNSRFGYSDEEETSVSVADGVQAKLFPNPNNGNFTLAYDLKKNNEATVFIIDVTGKEVYQSTIDNLENTKQINTSYLQSGIYFIQLRNDKTLLWTDKVMISK